MPAMRDLYAICEGRLLYRAFGHLLVAGDGWLLAAPLAAVTGRLNDLIDGCPVPFDEALAVIEHQPASLLPYDPAAQLFSDLVNGLVRLYPDGWAFEPMALCAGGSAVGLLSHPSGTRLAATLDVLWRPPPKPGRPFGTETRIPSFIRAKA